MFVKYRTKWSSGPGSWKYMELGSEEDVEESVIREEDIDPDPQHWRGVEYKKISCPPGDWLYEQIKNTKNTISALREKLIRYEGLLEAIEVLKEEED